MNKSSKKRQADGTPPVPITAAELERKFDAGESIMEHFDPAEDRIFSGSVEEEIAEEFARNTQPEVVHVEFPAWIVAELDHEAKRLGLGRQAVIKFWIAERLEQKARLRLAS